VAGVLWLLCFLPAVALVPGYAFPVIETAQVVTLKAKKGVVVKQELRIRNAGNADLLITKVDPSCGCTVSKFDKAPIKPGATSVIALEIDTKEKKLGKSFINIVIVSNVQYKFSKVRVDIEVQ
jgi:hypothetical protein